MLKALLAATLLAFVGPAMADAVAYIPNKEGGLIVLRADRCTQQWASLPTRRAAYVVNKDGSIQTPGCWTYDNTHVHMRWKGFKQTVAYPIALLRPVGKAL